MAIMIPEAVEGAAGAAGASSGAAAGAGGSSAARARASKPRVRGQYGTSGQLSYKATSAGSKPRVQSRYTARASQSHSSASPVSQAQKQITGTTPSQAGGGQKKKKSNVRKYYGYGKKGYQASRPAFKALTGREYGGVMLAEYLAGILILAVSMIIRGWSNGYLTTMSGFITRATALTGVFFVLFLLAPTKAGKAAMYFGALVDLAILFSATQQQVFTDVAKAVQGQPLTTDTTTVESNTDMPEPKSGLTLESTS